MLKKMLNSLSGMIGKLLFKGLKHLIFRPTAMIMIALLGVVACSGDATRRDVSSASPYGGTSRPARVKIGSPYQIKGETYHPRFEPSYAESGMASWYGPGFHGRSTASGERYDQHDMTAAHRTLPLPSIVRVTRVDTGESIKVRVNDRGPFHGNRIIDLSKAAANDLRMIGSGTAKVEVEYLHDETMNYITDLGLEAPSEMQMASSGITRKRVIEPEIRGVYNEPRMASYQPVRPQTQNQVAQQTKPALKIAWAEPVAKLQQGEEVESFRPVAATPAPTPAPFQVSQDSLADLIAQNTLRKQQILDSNVEIGTQFRVQTAAFSTLAKAEQHAKTLQPIAKPLITEVARDGVTLYRVSLTPVESYDTAIVMLKKTKQLGYNDARLMVE